MKFARRIILLLSLLASCSVIAYGTDDRCKYWQAKVDPSVKLPDVPQKNDELELWPGRPSKEDAEHTLEAIGCLLMLKGHTNSSRLGTVVSFSISSRFPPPTVEVAALYYISYLYHQNWRHANAIILVDGRGKRNTKKAIKAAFRGYESWFEKVKSIGLQKARKEKLGPLDGTEVRWY